jgi:hypothetical protein
MEDESASSAALALPAATPLDGKPVGGGELPVDVLLLVLLHLQKDMPTLMASLCAAACVARSWRTAASTPRLWTRIGPFRGNAAANLTDERLKLLVSRARHHLQHVDLRNISKACLTDEVLAAALRREKRIFTFCANGKPLTGAGVAAALAPSSGRLRQLLVRGVRALPKPESAGRMSSIQQDAFLVNCKQPLARLRALLAPEGSMKATAVCQASTGNKMCTRLCDNESACECGATYCMLHTDRVGSCGNCVDPICERCTSFAEDLCDGCFIEFEGDRDNEFDIDDI